MNQRLLISLFFILSMCCHQVVTAQDIHFSQFDFSPLNISPGFTGMFAEDVRFMGNYRNQWESVPVPYLTFSGAADMKLPNLLRKNKKIGLAAGLIFGYDRQGISELTSSSIGMSGSILYQVNDENIISFGVQTSAVQRAFQIDGLTFANQFNGDIFVPTLDTRENFDQTSLTYLDFSVGASWRLHKEDTRSHAIAGFGIFHLNSPDQSFSGATDAKLPKRISMYSGGIVEVHPQWDIIIHCLGQLQGVSGDQYAEILLGTAGRYHLNTTKGKEMAIQLGTTMRFGDAIIPTLAFHYTTWQVGLSYDINISDFDVATNGKGAFELGLIHTITHVKPVEVFESCPVF